MTTMGSRLLSYLRSSLNFYRIHMLAFLITPLLGATVLWASNGQFPIKFIDSLYICVSGVTGTGLITTDLSALTIWQQVVMVLLELVGNQACAAWIVVVVRRAYFRRHLQHIVAAEMHRTSTRSEATDMPRSFSRIRDALAHHRIEQQRHSSTTRKGQDTPPKLRPDMVRRLDVAPKLISPMGVETPRRESLESTAVTALSSGFDHDRDLRRITSRTSHRAPRVASQDDAEEADFGGFPGVQQVLSRSLNRVAPKVHQRLWRTVTMPRSETLVPDNGGCVAAADGPTSPKRVPYLSFTATVKKNSAFAGMTSEQFEELAGVEYRALNALLWIVPLYYFGLLSIAFLVTAPYMALPKWEANFLPPLQHKVINPIWFSAFQVVGAWANTGMSLVDQNMAPFQTAYPMIFSLVICVLAGNTCIPIFLRILIWTLTKIWPRQSRTKESLHFLLDHPRRCFIYLFPSRQTWLLVVIVLTLNLSNLLLDLVLNIGNPVTESISFGTRFVIAIVNAAACRNAGYQPIPVVSLYPAVQVLFVIMMYIAIFPIALSVRATNVYEEKALGIYDDDEEEDPINDEAHWNTSESRVAIWGRYLARHARRQLSFDMWWLALALLLLCVIERDNLIDPEKASYFNIFALVFEIVSAYGTVGLSLGVPGANYSLSGAMHTLSKLILCAVMVRGRHRGLPVALDRAVLLPREFLRFRSGRRRSDASTGEKEESGANTGGKEGDDVEKAQPPAQAVPEPLSPRVRARARTISLIVEENREAEGGSAGTDRPARTLSPEGSSTRDPGGSVSRRSIVVV